MEVCERVVKTGWPVHWKVWFLPFGKASDVTDLLCGAGRWRYGWAAPPEVDTAVAVPVRLIFSRDRFAKRGCREWEMPVDRLSFQILRMGS